MDKSQGSVCTEEEIFSICTYSLRRDDATANRKGENLHEAKPVSEMSHYYKIMRYIE